MHIFMIEYFNPNSNKHTQEYYRTLDSANKRYANLLEQVKADKGDSLPTIYIVFVMD